MSKEIKVLFVNDGIHHKNLQSLNRYNRIHFDIIYSRDELPRINTDIYDCVYSPGNPIDVKLYPNTKFVFGPQFSVFPDKKFDLIHGDKVAYIILSKWCYDIYAADPLTQGIRLEAIPFGVDTERFREIVPRAQRNKVFIYHKFRNPDELQVLMTLLQMKGIDFRVFSYHQKYQEQDYLDYLQQAKYGIWFGGHESQGFALQEALSCNVPLFVWSVTSMSQEYGSSYPFIPATTVPYWDYRCGEVIHDLREFAPMFEIFLSRLDHYKPREYVLENLSTAVCEQKFIDLVKSL